MLFGADELRDLLGRLAAGQDIVAHVDVAVLEAAIAEADQLAAGRAEAEVPAIFAALARRSRALGPLAQDGIPTVARAFALAHGLRLTADIELDILRARVLYGAITFDELRAVFAAKLHPLGEGPPPQARKRPR
jgi:hypothetical protein